MTRVNRGSLKSNYRALFGVIIVGVVWLLAYGEGWPGEPARGQAPCPVCGAAVAQKAVVVTDWETNREYSYHDLSCAVREMGTLFPWSRAVTSSAASGQRVTLTRINGSWRAQPEESVAVMLAPQGDCHKVVVFASLAESRDYQAKHKGEIPEDARGIPLAALPAQIMVMAPARETGPPTAGQAAPPPAAGEPVVGQQIRPGGGQLRAEAAEQPTSPAFRDVPAHHWAAGFVEKVKSLGLMEGYPDGTFRGDQPVTRYELAAILSRLVDRTAATASPEAATVGAPEVAPAPAPAPGTTPGAPSPGAGEMKSSIAPPEAKKRAKPSLLGLSGLMLGRGF